MPVPWHKRKDRVKLYEQRNKEEGRLPYFSDRARFINRNAREKYGRTEKVTGQQLKHLYEISNKACFYCKTPLTPAQVHFDHMDPLSKGGENTVENLCTACGPCNLSKNDSSIDEFLLRVEETQTPERIYKTLFCKGV